jgi:hypothetical protein
MSPIIQEHRGFIDNTSAMELWRYFQQMQMMQFNAHWPCSKRSKSIIKDEGAPGIRLFA